MQITIWSNKKKVLKVLYINNKSFSSCNWFVFEFKFFFLLQSNKSKSNICFNPGQRVFSDAVMEMGLFFMLSVWIYFEAMAFLEVMSPNNLQITTSEIKDLIKNSTISSKIRIAKPKPLSTSIPAFFSYFLMFHKSISDRFT